MNSNHCIVLMPEVARTEVQSALALLGLTHHHTWEQDAAGEGYEEVWTNSARDIAVNYVESRLFNVAYLTIRGERSDALCADIEIMLRVFSPSELLDAVRAGKTHNERVQALSKLAAMFPSYDEQTYRVFVAAATQHENTLLQEAAINAMGYRGWPQYIPVLEAIAAGDPSESVRNRAVLTLIHVIGEKFVK
ncbi:MAG: HEAT repeat domain-containing protein [Bdellovibrionaceae bacterium]|nr:HEAT repeat domain-containing protein [Pseudobdellovibrionaceae bacterium]